MNIQFLTILFLILTSCQVAQKKAPDKTSSKHSPSRHGWTVFSGPKRTLLGVNDMNSVARGKKVYQNHCAKCHGPKGKGNGPVAKILKIKPADLTMYSKTRANYYIVFQINEGRGDMPMWKDVLSTKETWDLSNYIQSLTNN